MSTPGSIKSEGDAITEEAKVTLEGAETLLRSESDADKDTLKDVAKKLGALALALAEWALSSQPQDPRPNEDLSIDFANIKAILKWWQRIATDLKSHNLSLDPLPMLTNLGQKFENMTSTQRQKEEASYYQEQVDKMRLRLQREEKREFGFFDPAMNETRVRLIQNCDELAKDIISLNEILAALGPLLNRQQKNQLIDTVAGKQLLIEGIRNQLKYTAQPFAYKAIAKSKAIFTEQQEIYQEQKRIIDAGEIFTETPVSKKIGQLEAIGDRLKGVGFFIKGEILALKNTFQHLPGYDEEDNARVKAEIGKLEKLQQDIQTELQAVQPQLNDQFAYLMELNPEQIPTDVHVTPFCEAVLQGIEKQALVVPLPGLAKIYGVILNLPLENRVNMIAWMNNKLNTTLHTDSWVDSKVESPTLVSSAALIKAAQAAWTTIDKSIGMSTRGSRKDAKNRLDAAIKTLDPIAIYDAFQAESKTITDTKDVGLFGGSTLRDTANIFLAANKTHYQTLKGTAPTPVPARRLSRDGQ